MVVATHIDRLCSHRRQPWVGGQIQRGEQRRRVLQLMQTKRHAIGMETAILQGQADRLCNLVCGVLPMQAEEAHELAHAVAVPAIGAQARQQLLIDGGPACTPAADGFGVVEGSWPLLQEGKIVQWIKNILLPAVAAGMAGQDPV